ncbi:MAG: hypothetical protein GOV15_02715, partial [Candidatus Diapherotrites archaeon]|nr:hypothetical protein [Candidatus Diapherotrites archaeon]
MLDVSWIKKVKSKDAVLVVGLPGIGLLGRISVEFFINELKPVKVAELFSHSLPSMVITGKDGVVRALRSDLYYLKRSGDKDKDVFFLLCDAQPALPPQGSFDAQHVFSSELIEFLSEAGVSQVFTIAGLPDEARPFEGFNVTVAVTDKKVFKSLKGEFKVQQPGLPISGAAGLLLYYATRKKMTGACVIGSTSSGN